LSADGIRRMEQMYWGNTPKLLRKSLLPETEHIYVSHFLHHQWNKKNSDRKWKFISLVRDPIARNVSEFFYSVDTTKVEPYLPNFYELLESRSIHMPDLIEAFLLSFHPESEDFNLPLIWFDDEFKKFLNVDVYSLEFPKTQGYQIIKNGSSDILILKLESLMDCYQQAFSEFLNLDDFRLITANVAGQKKYYPVYKGFIKEVNLPENYINKMYESKYVKHFYTQKEIEGFRMKWQRQLSR
jgi:hypothetical protein